MKRVHFIRHGKTERQAETGRDFDRKLIDRGHNQSKAIGAELQAPPDTKVLCSTAARTRETLAGIRTNAELSDIDYRDDLYLCNMRQYLELIWSCKHSSDLMFVGHNFGISDVVCYLSGEELEMRTGEYILMEFDVTDWQEISAELGVIAYRYRLPNP